MEVEEGVMAEVPELCYSWLTQLRCYMWAYMDTQSSDAYSADPDMDSKYFTPDMDSNMSYYEDTNYSEDMDDGSTDSVDYEEYDRIERQIKYLTVYLSPLILFFSMVGNLFSAIILCKLCHQVWSSCVYLAILAILDQILVLVWCGNNWIYAFTFYDITNQILLSSSSFCKVYTFSFNYTFHMEKWLLICLAVECFIASKYPDRVSHMCTLSKAKAIVLLLTVILACLNIHFFWTFEVEDVSGQGIAEIMFSKQFRCHFVSKGFQFNEVFKGLVWPITDLVLAQIIPLALITVLSSLALYHTKFGTAAAKYTKQEERSKYLVHPSAFHQLKMSFIVVNFSYTILTIPRLAITIYKVYLENYPTENLDIVTRLKIDRITAVTFFLEYAFLGIKFYILVVGCKLFRDKFIKLCKSLCGCCLARRNRQFQQMGIISPQFSSSSDQRRRLMKNSYSNTRSDSEPVHYLNHNSSPTFTRDISPRVSNNREQTMV